MNKTKTVGMILAVAGIIVASVACAEPAQATLTLTDAIERLPIVDETRDGYQRGKFPHWIDEDSDTCDTRKEVLITEAVQPVTVTGVCMITNGSWWSYYDAKDVTEARGLDIDHLVPLAEAWDSGASTWTRDRRRAYANDLGDEHSLVAVTAATNRSKADQDPFSWMPPSPDARCRYIIDWTIVKTRWSLNVDGPERQALLSNAFGCDAGFPEVDIVP